MHRSVAASTVPQVFIANPCDVCSIAQHVSAFRLGLSQGGRYAAVEIISNVFFRVRIKVSVSGRAGVAVALAFRVTVRTRILQALRVRIRVRFVLL